MTNTEYRQFIDEVYFLGKQKQFAGIFNKIIPSLQIWKSAKNVLLDKRKAYDFALANIFRKYGVENDSLYNELDKIWNEVPDFIMSFNLIPFNSNTTVLQCVFDKYIDESKKYCDTFVKGLIDEL